MGRGIVLLVMLVMVAQRILAQENTMVFGIQFKPMVPSKFFGSGPERTFTEEVEVEFTPRFGYNFGMFIKQGISKMISVETGISLVHRNYDVDFYHDDIEGRKRIDFRLVSYEIPVQALVYVQLGKQFWMNASGGFSVDMYPSDVHSETFERRDSVVYDFGQRTFRNGWLQFALLANYGFEYRTPEDGSFYLGASFHRPFSSIAKTVATFKKDNYPSTITYSLSGTYLTLDLRYIFPESRKKSRSRTSED